jgi:hypothetical protein
MGLAQSTPPLARTKTATMQPRRGETRGGVNEKATKAVTFSNVRKQNLRLIHQQNH